MADALSDEDLSALDQLGSGDIGIPADLLRPQRAASRPGDLIPYQPSSAFTEATGISPDQYDTFRGYLAQHESKSYGQLPIPTGSKTGPKTVSGRYQMGPDEIAGSAARLGIANPSTDQFLADPALQEQLFENYTLDHHNQLMKNPLYANGDANTRMALLAGAHLGGPGAITAWQGGENRRDRFGTGVASYINGMYQTATGEPMPTGGGPGAAGGMMPGGLMQLAAAGKPQPAAPLSDDETAQLDQVGTGQALVGLPAGMTPEQALAQPHKSMVSSDPETLGIPKGATPMLDPAQLQKKAEALALGGMNVGPIQTQIDQIQQGKMLYRMPDGTAQWLIQPGGPADPKRLEYNELLGAHARATGETVPAYINTPYGQVQISVPKDQYLDYQRKFPSLQLAPGATFPEGATTPPAPGAGPGPPPGPGQPPAAAPGAGPPGAPGAPAAPAGEPGMPVVTPGKEGPAVITPPAAGPGLPQGLMGPRYLPPGGEAGTTAQITSDQKTVNDLTDAAREAQRIKSLSQGVLGALGNVQTGKLGPISEQVSSWLKSLGMSDEAAKAISGSQADNAQILVKQLLQQAAAQMAGSGHGFNLMSTFLENLPSIETSKDAIRMFENTVNMQAQRALDNRDQAVGYFNKSFGDYKGGKALDYNPLTTFQSAFDQANPDLNYYRAAQVMSQAFAKEGHEGAKATGSTDPVMRLIPRGSTFYDENGNPMRRDSTGNMVPVKPAAAPATPPATPLATPPAAAPGGGAQAAPAAPPGTPEGATLVPNKTFGGKPVYRTPDGRYWQP